MNLPNDKATPVLFRAPKMKILVVEDDKVSRLLLRKILEKDGSCEVVEAINGRVAWELLDQGLLPDLCVMDVLMPEMSGIELLRKMRADERFREQKVILCTALNDRNTITQAASLEIDGYILKPYNGAKVFEQVYKVLVKSPSLELQELVTKMSSHLGLDQEEYLNLLTMLAQEVKQVLLCTRDSLIKGEIYSATQQVNTLRSACSNLGVSFLLARADGLAAALADASQTSPTERRLMAELNKIDPATTSAITVLEQMEKENKRLSENLAKFLAAREPLQ